MVDGHVICDYEYGVRRTMEIADYGLRKVCLWCAKTASYPLPDTKPWLGDVGK